jgi:archaeosine synthase
MFYLEKRDGLARTGRLEIFDVKLETPYLFDFGDKNTTDILKHLDFGKASYPVKFLNEEIFQKLKHKEGKIRIVTGLSVLTPRKTVEVFSEVKKDFKPVYAVATATPSNLSLLIYMGVDIVDNILAIARAYQGIYFLSDFEIRLEELKKLPCSCEVCREYGIELKKLSYEERSELLARHNTEMLKNQLEVCRVLIAKEELRNYVESRAKLKPELTVLLRLSEGLSEECYSRFKGSTCYFNTIESFNRFEVRYFLKRALDCYKPETEILLILPCTAKKPYLTSNTHRRIRSRVKIGVNEIIVSSPLVVPREFELLYPAMNYDTPVTGYWSDEEVGFVAGWLQKFVEKGEFEKIIAHVGGGYRDVVEKALSDYEVVFTAEDGILSERSLENLKREVEEHGFSLYKSMFEHMFRYQFGVEVGGRVRGKYPEIELYRGKNRIARVDTKYGMLDIYEDIAREFVENNIYSVRIDEFEPTSTIFAAGVIEAADSIRPNDLVVFHNEAVYGVGISAMSAREMIESDKGIAIRVKRKWRF